MGSKLVSSFGEQEITGILFLINGSIQVHPHSLYFDVYFIRPKAIANAHFSHPKSCFN